MTILVVDDERKITSIIKSYLKKEGFDVILAFDGEEAIDKLNSNKVDLVILDWMIPKFNGTYVCTYIKENISCKVLMLTAKSQIEDEVYAFNIGADDYIKKPFDMRVLLIRVRKLLGIHGDLSFKDLRVNLNKQRAYINERDLNLTRTELEILTLFMKNKGVILSRYKIIDLIWGSDYDGDPRTVDTHIRRLRRKIGEGAIKTHRGIGYSLEGDED